MNDIRLDVIFTLRPTDEGGRQTALQLYESSSYRPHLVIGNIKQAKIILDEKGWAKENLIAIEFPRKNRIIEFGTSVNIQFKVLALPKEELESLVPGATFTVREGAQIIGHGTILDLTNE